MEIGKRIRSSIDKRFEKHPIGGFILYGIMTGLVGSIVFVILFLLVSLLTGIYGRLGINYKTWWTIIVIVAVIAILVFIYGAMLYFPYKRKGNSLFKKEYVNGQTYKALHKYLTKNEDGRS